MGYVEKRSGEKYRARYRDPIGRKHSKSFRRKADAGRFLVEMEADLVRGRWLDPKGADQSLSWVEEFLRLARRVSPQTQETYARGLTKQSSVPCSTYGHRQPQLGTDLCNN